MSSPINVLIADDDPAVRAVLEDVVVDVDGLALVGVASDAPEAIRLAVLHRPDVALVDVRMPGGGGAEATRGILASCPQTKVVALSAHEDRNAVMWMLRAGACGYVVKGAPVEELIEAVRQAFSGGGTLSSRVASQVITELAGRLDVEADEEQRRQEMVARIRGILGGRRLRSVLQPIFDVATGQVEGFEALARFPPDGNRTPDMWFRDAREAGLGVELEVEAVRSALGHLPRLPPEAFLSVNASPDAATSEALTDLLMPAAHRIVVEITEHAPVEDYAGLEEALRGLRSAGGRLAIDDAGAGFASLRHIVRLAPDIIKLDISLTSGIDSDRTKRALATALISFAGEIGATVVAEGVETQAELSTLRELGVPRAQGYHLGRPMDADDLTRWLASHADRRIS